MLKHQFKDIQDPNRVVILGGSGFVGGAIAKNLKLRSVDVLALSSADIDLKKEQSHNELASIIKCDDVVVGASAVAPVKNILDLGTNIKIIKNIHDALEYVQPCHFVNVGSDAVFCDIPLPLDENSSRAPDSFHGVMHLTREIAFSQLAVPLVTIRPTLIYGKDDPHNGYGPNRFARLAANDEEILLFGDGEERRDHIFIDDVAELVVQTILHRSTGSLNAVTGSVWSFREIASLVIEHANSSSKIKGTKRVGKMPHNGLRTFNNNQIFEAFPDFRFTSLSEGIANYFN